MGTITVVSPNCQIRLLVIMERLPLHMSDIVCDLRQLDIVCSLLVANRERDEMCCVCARLTRENGSL